MSRILGPETAKSHKCRKKDKCKNFYHDFLGYQYAQPLLGLDIGYKGSEPNALPVLETATGVDVDYPGYDGRTLPFADESQDYVFTSHVLEHISDWQNALRDWFRVLKPYGHLILIVPHRDLYEKKLNPPSRWNEDHKRFYIPSLLLFEVQAALPTNSWRLRHMRDNDDGFDYSIPPEKHSGGCYEIECVIQKIKKPDWDVK